MDSTAKKVAEQVVGKSCTNFRLAEGGILILFFDSGTKAESTFNRIWIDVAWRLRTSGQILVGSLDDSTMLLEKLRVLPGRSLERLELADVSGDLRLVFAGDYTIESFGYSVLDEQWEYRGADGRRIGVGENFQPFDRRVNDDT